MIELEKTYLAKEIPKGLENCDSKEIIDIYIPKEARHPTIRIRKNGDKYEITKKEPVEDDVSHQNEFTIPLTEKEFNELIKIGGKEIHKIRYYHDYNGKTAEIDLFLDKLKGLVLVDFEFETMEEKNSFEMPDFCLIEITQEEFIAGGMVCGKSYEDIEEDLKRFNYKKLEIK